jgi:exodeoxyribonuclease III
MRIVVWNCCMALHEKYERLLDLKPDIAIVPECAEPDVLRRKAPGFSFADCEWRGTEYPDTGVDPNKGLGVFTFGDLRLRLHHSWDPRFHLFLPLEVRGRGTPLNLLAVWAFNDRVPASVSPNPATTAKAIEHYAPFLRPRDSVVAGDFNGSVVWDDRGGYGKFADVDRTLDDLGLTSAYHAKNVGEKLGEERQPTHFWQRNVTQPFHIDYVYMPKSWVGDALVTVGTSDEWLSASDHAPVVVEVPSLAHTLTAERASA